MMYIGRDAGCSVVLPNTAVSRRHAKLTKKDGGWQIEDLDSPNGTLLNDEPVKKAMLQHKDIVRIGRYRLEYLVEELLDFEGQRQLEVLGQHERTPLADGTDTYVLSEAMRTKLLKAEKARDLMVIAQDKPGGLTWRPEGRTLKIGPGGDVPARQFGRNTPVAVLEWDGQQYIVRRLGFWGKLVVNGTKVDKASVKPGDRLQVGGDGFLLREQPF